MKVPYVAKMLSNGGVIYHCFGNNIESLQVQIMMLLETEFCHTQGVIMHSDTGAVVFECRKSAY